MTTGTRTPRAVYTLIAINVVAYLVVAVQAHATSGFLIRSAIFDNGVLFGPYVGDGEIWRIVTSGFLHYSIMHIALNMFTLFIIGRDLEMALGTARFVGVYVTSLLGGSAAALVFSADAATAGASGAIYGLLGGLFIAFIRAKLPLTQIIGIIALNIVLSLMIANISIWAHLGGLVFGAAATASVLFLPAWCTSHGWRGAVQIVSWVAMALLSITAVVISLAVSAG